MNDYMCGRGVCAANAGHSGTCDEASGWVYDPPSERELEAMLRAAYEEGWDAHANLPHIKSGGKQCHR